VNAMSDLLLSFILLRPLAALAENTFGSYLVLGRSICLLRRFNVCKLLFLWRVVVRL